MEYVKARGEVAADPSAAASNNSMYTDVNAPDVSGRSQTQERFGLAQTGLFDPRFLFRYLYTGNIPCYKWTCSLSGDRSDVSLAGNRKSSPVNAFLSLRIITMRQDSPSVSAKAIVGERQVDKT